MVKGIDVDAGMLEVAERRLREAGLASRVELAEMGVAELDREPPESYDAVSAGLCLSELSEDELAYTLSEVARVLKPTGLFLVADEVRPQGLGGRALHWLIKAPIAVLTYLITQQTSHAVAELPEKLASAGLTVVSLRTSPLGSFAEVVARKPEVWRR